jgi:sialidase-1
VGQPLEQIAATDKVQGNVKLKLLITCAAILSLAVSPYVARADGDVKRIDLWTAGQGGYEQYRIPGMIVTPKGSLLAYCEARARPLSDWGKIDLMIRRSTDGGRTWNAPRLLARPPADAKKNAVAVERKIGNPDGITMNNPVAIADAKTGAVHFLYCVEYARCFYMRSTDDGVTFSEPVEITATFERFRDRHAWRVIATGPGHGIQLTSGRLVVPVWLSLGTNKNGHGDSVVATVYSDDAGKTWRAGDIAADGSFLMSPNETSAAELSDGRVMMNIRHLGVAGDPGPNGTTWRGVVIGPDGATSWSKPRLERDLPEPVCMGSLLRIGRPGAGGKPRLLFANPANGEDRKRRNVTVRMSDDDGATWRPGGRVIDPGTAGYSDLAAAPEGRTVYCLYERGPRVQALTLVSFTVPSEDAR